MWGNPCRGRAVGRRPRQGRGREVWQPRAALAQGDRGGRRQYRRSDRRAREIVADGAGVSFATHICDVEVDPETAVRASCAIRSSRTPARRFTRPTSRASIRAAPAQGIGWALNEEYVYGKDGRLQNPGFLDYRIPVCSDLPMIDTQILEIPNPNHPMACAALARPRLCRPSPPSPMPCRTRSASA